MSGLALVAGRGGVRATPLENPRQTSAFCYDARYSPQSPKFSRGVAVSRGPWAVILISGTASITRSEARHPGDPEAQAREAIDNIAALVSEENLRRHGLPGRGMTPADLLLARVYVKRPEHFNAVRAVCEARLGGEPSIYTFADVCRPELLVEIEGIAWGGSAAGR